MADIKMNAFSPAEDVTYIYGELADGSQGRIAKDNLMKAGGIFRFYGNIKSGEHIVLPYKSGIIMIQSASSAHEKAFAIINGSGLGTVLIENSHINFFSEISNKICVLNTGTNTNYIVKNMSSMVLTVSVVFIG